MARVSLKIMVDQHCEHDLIGDTYCDGNNNNEECGFDGGDCCDGEDHYCQNCFENTCLCLETMVAFCSSTTFI